MTSPPILHVPKKLCLLDFCDVSPSVPVKLLLLLLVCPVFLSISQCRCICMFSTQEDGEDEEGEGGGDDNPTTLAGHVTNSQPLEEGGVELDIMSPRTADRTQKERTPFDIREIVKECQSDSNYENQRGETTCDVHTPFYVTNMQEPSQRLWDLGNAQRYICTEPVSLFGGSNSSRDSILPSIQS